MKEDAGTTRGNTSRAGGRSREGCGLTLGTSGGRKGSVGGAEGPWGEQRSGRRLWRIAQSQTGHRKPSVSVLDLEGEGKLPAVSPGLGKTSTATDGVGAGAIGR